MTISRPYNNGSIYVAPYKKYQKALEINGNITLSSKVIGEFVCDDISKFTAEFTDGKTYEDIRFYYLDECEEEQEMIICSNEWKNPSDCWLCKQSSLLFEDLRNYIGENFHNIPFYSWHISDLVIYDKPKQLSEFNINRAPQSWCYVQED